MRNHVWNSSLVACFSHAKVGNSPMLASRMIDDASRRTMPHSTYRGCHRLGKSLTEQRASTSSLRIEPLRSHKSNIEQQQNPQQWYPTAIISPSSLSCRNGTRLALQSHSTPASSGHEIDRTKHSTPAC